MTQYFNNLTEPNGQVRRVISIDLDGVMLFQPCVLTVAVLNTPDPPIIRLPVG